MSTKGWDYWARRAIVRLAVEHRDFTTDDVWMSPELDSVPVNKDPRGLGRIMLDAQIAGLIAPTPEHLPSVMSRCHHRPKRVWRSLVTGDRRRIGKDW